jgi:hypothetical protein
MRPAAFENTFSPATESELPEVDPFAPMPEPEPAESPFGESDQEATLTGSPFAVDEPAESPFATPEPTAAEPFAAQQAAPFAAAAPTADRAQLEIMQASARRVVDALEAALKTARDHADAIEEQLRRS